MVDSSSDSFQTLSDIETHHRELEALCNEVDEKGCNAAGGLIYKVPSDKVVNTESRKAGHKH